MKDSPSWSIWLGRSNKSYQFSRNMWLTWWWTCLEFLIVDGMIELKTGAICQKLLQVQVSPMVRLIVCEMEGSPACLGPTKTLLVVFDAHLSKLQNSVLVAGKTIQRKSFKSLKFKGSTSRSWELPFNKIQRKILGLSGRRTVSKAL